MMKTEGYYLYGVSLSMAANRISYSFDLQGPSYICDTACSSSIYAFVQAFNDLQNGLVDNAIVGSTHITFIPHDTIEFSKLNMLSPEGYCRPFSSERNGYVRAEGVIACLLQKKSNARRWYATAAGGRINSDGYKKEGISFPSYEAHINLLQDVYNDFNLNCDHVTYVEAHGTGIYELYY